MLADEQGVGVGLPDGWPSSLPLPPGARCVDDESDGEALRVSFEVADEHDLESFFLKALVHAGWRVELCADDADEIALEIEGHGFFGQVEIARSPAAGSSERFVVQLV